MRGHLGVNFGIKLHEVLHKKKFRTTLGECWKEIYRARSSSLCSVCSGRSDQFFFRDRILVLQSDCEQILSKCAPSFENLVVIIEILGKHFSSFQNLTSNSTDAFKEKLNYLMNLTETIKTEDIHSSIHHYLNATGDLKDHLAGNLCSKFLNINGQTFIEKLATLLKKINFDFIDHAVSEATIEIQNQNNGSTHTANPSLPSATKANFEAQDISSQRRLLNEESTPLLLSESSTTEEAFGEKSLPPVESFFSGDVTVVVMNKDSSYSSYFGAVGTTLASHVGGKPFNITNNFP